MLSILQHTLNTLTHSCHLRETSSQKNLKTEWRKKCRLAAWGQMKDQEEFFFFYKFAELGFFGPPPVKRHIQSQSISLPVFVVFVSEEQKHECDLALFSAFKHFSLTLMLITCQWRFASSSFLSVSRLPCSDVLWFLSPSAPLTDFRVMVRQLYQSCSSLNLLAYPTLILSQPSLPHSSPVSRPLLSSNLFLPPSPPPNGTAVM